MARKGDDVASGGKRGSCPECGDRTSTNESAIANDHNMSKQDVENVIHQLKEKGPETGDFGKKNGNV